MPRSPENFESLVFRTAESPFKAYPTADPGLRTLVGALFVLFAFALMGAFVFIPIFRNPVGTSHSVSGTVAAIGFSSRGRLVATVRLASGTSVRVAAPYAVKLSPGMQVTLSEQPLRFGQPTYSLISTQPREASQ